MYVCSTEFTVSLYLSLSLSHTHTQTHTHTIHLPSPLDGVLDYIQCLHSAKVSSCWSNNTGESMSGSR